MRTETKPVVERISIPSDTKKWMIQRLSRTTRVNRDLLRRFRYENKHSRASSCCAVCLSVTVTSRHRIQGKRGPAVEHEEAVNPAERCLKRTICWCQVNCRVFENKFRNMSAITKLKGLGHMAYLKMSGFTPYFGHLGAPLFSRCFYTIMNFGHFWPSLALDFPQCQEPWRWRRRRRARRNCQKRKENNT